MVLRGQGFVASELKLLFCESDFGRRLRSCLEVLACRRTTFGDFVGLLCLKGFFKFILERHRKDRKDRNYLMNSNLGDKATFYVNVSVTSK